MPKVYKKTYLDKVKNYYIDTINVQNLSGNIYAVTKEYKKGYSTVYGWVQKWQNDPQVKQKIREVRKEKRSQKNPILKVFRYIKKK